MSEVTNLLLVFVIITAFYIQGQSHYRPLVRGFGVQSVAMALLSLYSYVTTGDMDYLLLGLMILIIREFVIPLILQRIPGKRYVERENFSGVASLLVLDMAFFFTSVIVIFTLAISRIFPDDPGIVFPLSLFFQGLFLMGSRRSTPSQILGYLEEENAIVVLGLTLFPLPLLIEASALLDILALVVISSVIVLEKRDHLPLEELRG